MSLLAEEIVEEWLNREGYFTFRGIRVGVHEIDLLAIRPQVRGWKRRHTGSAGVGVDLGGRTLKEPLQALVRSPVKNEAEAIPLVGTVVAVGATIIDIPDVVSAYQQCFARGN